MPRIDIIPKIQRLVEEKYIGLIPLLNRPLLKDFDHHQLVALMDPEIWEVADENRITTLLLEALGGRRGETVPKKFAMLLENQSALMADLLEEVDRVNEILSKNKVDIILLENGGLAHSVFRNPSSYSFGDFELLINLRDLQPAHEVLLDDGYKLLTGQSEGNATGLNLADGRAVYKGIIGGREVRLNLQPTLVARRWFFSDLEPSFSDLLYRSTSVSNKGLSILGAEDFLLQLCIHNASHGYLRNPGIRLHLDVDWYVRATGDKICWQTFLSLVKASQVNTIVYFALLISYSVLNTPIPIELFTQIRPKRWKEKMIRWSLRRGNLLSPNTRQFSNVEFLVFNILIAEKLAVLVRSVFPTRECLIRRYGLMESRSRLFFIVKHYRNVICKSDKKKIK